MPIQRNTWKKKCRQCFACPGIAPIPKDSSLVLPGAFSGILEFQSAIGRRRRSGRHANSPAGAGCFQGFQAGAALRRISYSCSKSGSVQECFGFVLPWIQRNSLPALNSASAVLHKFSGRCCLLDRSFPLDKVSCRGLRERCLKSWKT